MFDQSDKVKMVKRTSVIFLHFNSCHSEPFIVVEIFRFMFPADGWMQFSVDSHTTGIKPHFVSIYSFHRVPNRLLDRHDMHIKPVSLSTMFLFSHISISIHL